MLHLLAFTDRRLMHDLQHTHSASMYAGSVRVHDLQHTVPVRICAYTTCTEEQFHVHVVNQLDQKATTVIPLEHDQAQVCMLPLIWTCCYCARTHVSRTPRSGCITSLPAPGSHLECIHLICLCMPYQSDQAELSCANDTVELQFTEVHGLEACIGVGTWYTRAE